MKSKLDVVDMVDVTEFDLCLDGVKEIFVAGMILTVSFSGVKLNAVSVLMKKSIISCGDNPSFCNLTMSLGEKVGSTILFGEGGVLISHLSFAAIKTLTKFFIYNGVWF